MVDSPPREVKRLYWDLFQTTEIWVRLIPENPDGTPPLVNLIFQAFFAERAERDPYTGLPEWPKAAPGRLVVRAEPQGLTVIRELSLRLIIDGKRLDLTAPGSRYTTLGCGIGRDNCAANAVEAELTPAMLRVFVAAHVLRAEVLGFSVRITAADQQALKEFADRVHLP